MDSQSSYGVYSALCSRGRIGVAAVLIGNLVLGGAIAGELAQRGTQAGRFVEIADPLSSENRTFPLIPTDPPEPGGSVPDARLGTVQTRVVGSEKLRHEYARHDPFNTDCTKILLFSLANGKWNIYRTSTAPYDHPSNFVRSVEVEEPRWDQDNPDVVWATAGCQILRIDVERDEATVVKDFRDDPLVGPILQRESDLYRITMKDEGEASRDRRYWAFLVQGMDEDYRARYLICWDRQQDKVRGLRELSAKESRIDWAGMSPNGNWVLVGADHDNGGELPGLSMLDRDLRRTYPLHYSTGHSDVGLDSDGNEVIVMQNAQTDYVDLIPLDPSSKPIPPGGGYEGSGHVPLIRLYYASDSPVGFNSGVHISCNFPGWCVVSTHMEPDVAEKNWLDRSIVLVRLDRRRPSVFYLAKVYGTCGAYWEETHATISGNGSRVVWATNWGRHVGEEAVWIAELQLGAGWPDVLARP